MNKTLLIFSQWKEREEKKKTIKLLQTFKIVGSD